MSQLPCSGFDEVEGYLALPRMLAKARLKRADPTFIYFVYDASPLDALVLSRLKLSGAQVEGWLDQGWDDSQIALEAARLVGHDRAAREAWSRKLLFTHRYLLMMLDADEGRLADGPLKATLQVASNVIYPVMKTINRLRGLA
ncbi:MAG: hypothetical protein JWM80_361 [Cyanobacteria bacterium RYN_339]|nr:hypothetical protein [Cyanobacteria bacterium RYN_339]